MIRRYSVAISAAFCLAVATAQEVRITNIANVERTQWVDIALPLIDAAALPTFCRMEPQGFIAWKGANVGQHSTMFHVLAHLAPSETLTGRIVGVAPQPAALQPWVMSDWVADDTAAVFIRPVVVVNGQERRLGGSIFREVESNNARRVYHLSCRLPGTPLVFDQWLYVYAAQDTVRVEFTLTNSDPTTPELSLNIDLVWLESQELLELDYRRLLGMAPPRRQLQVPGHQSFGRYVQVVSGPRTMGRGESIFLSGWMLCNYSADRTPTPLSYEAHGTTVNMSVGERITSMAAARFGPAVGVCTDWAGKWLAFGTTPEIPPANRARGGWDSADASASAFQNLLATMRDLNAQRPRGLQLRAGSTGAQEDFGACKGAFAVTVGDPRLIYELGYSVYEIFARPSHYREVDCRPVLQSNHPNWRTWSQILHCPTTGDRLGMNCPLPYSWPSNGYTGIDDQHRSQNNFNAALALTGSHAMRLALKELLEVDLAQVPNRIDSPRGEGRLGMAWANMMLLLDDPADRSNLLQHMRRRVQTAQMMWPGRRFTNDASRPIRVLGIGRDPTFRDPQGNQIPAIIVWEHAIAAMGYYAMWRVTGDQAMHDMAVEASQLVVNHCIYHDNTNWIACTAVRYLEGAQEGQALPPSSYYPGSPDIHVSISFWTWIYPAVLICRELARGVNADQVARCDAIVAGFEPAGPHDWGRSEWWAVMPR